MKVKATVTKEGAALNSNNWKEGDIIECHPNLAVHFAKKGFVKCKEGDAESGPEYEIIFGDTEEVTVRMLKKHKGIKKGIETKLVWLEAKKLISDGIAELIETEN